MKCQPASSPLSSGPQPTIKIFIKTLTVSTLVVVVRPDDRVDDLVDLGPDGCRLLYQGRQLELGHRLSDYGTGDGATLHMIMRLCGGRGRA